MRSNKFSILILAISIIFLSLSVNNNFTWFRIYDSSYHSDNYAFSISKGDGSNYYILGSTLPKIENPNGTIYSYVLKINQFGDTIWSKILTNHSTIYASIPTSNGGCVFAGDSRFSIKINSDGSIGWDKTYSGVGVIYDIKRTKDSGYIACGSALNFYGFLLKLDSLGNKQWSRILQEGFQSTLNSVEVLNSKNFIATGTYRNTFSSGTKTIFILFDSLGNILVNNKLNAKNRVSGGVKIDNVGDNIVISGNTVDSIGLKTLPYFQRLDSSGNILFTKIFESDKEEIFEDVIIIDENKYLFNVQRIVVINDSNIAKTFITDSIGNVIMQNTYPVANVYTRLVCSDKTKDSYIIFAGMIGNDSTFANDNTLVIKTDSNLNYKTTQIINSNFTIEDYELYQNYPNPFNNSTNIKFSISKDANVNIQITDVTGKESKLIILGQLKKGIHSYFLSLPELASGIYIYSLVIDSKIIIPKKMIFLK